MDCIDAAIMAALGDRFNRRIYGCRWSVGTMRGEPDGRRPPDSLRQHHCLFIIGRHTVLATPRIVRGWRFSAFPRNRWRCLRKRPAGRS